MWRPLICRGHTAKSHAHVLGRVSHIAETHARVSAHVDKIKPYSSLICHPICIPPRSTL
ncbi:hypothetical protein F383_06708 [Gossypium arboreum]|uniref:Uncharacterized protein n=1 Tax=Gossypium arboreum TaxID=29729 RepID=A0A0B0PK10_GOSAR|nr:hypothetical protein F383_06708 [Gossypium arboreum]